MRKAHFPIAFAASLLGIAAMSSCQDEVSGIGSSLFEGEVAVKVDSLTLNLDAKSIERPTFDPRSGTTLLGSLNTPEYGSLKCAYVARLLPAQQINLPDSITPADVDSAKVYLAFTRSSVVGDSLAPQQLKLYKLTKQLPDAPASNFNPAGYYNPADLLGMRNYTLSGLSLTDSAFTKLVNIPVTIPLTKEWGAHWLQQYRTNPSIFEWPQTFAQSFPGIYVEPSFGRGCIGSIAFTRFFIYTHHRAKKNVMVDGVSTPTWYDVKDSTCLFSTAPEVLSSNIVHYTPSQRLRDMAQAGKCIITTPGGYVTQFTFPAKEVLKGYWADSKHLEVINSLTFSIPAARIANAHGISVPPQLLMVKRSELDAFFADHKIPDNKTSFYASYSKSTGTYTFSNMRQYLIDLAAKGGDNISAEDTDFVLVPVTLATETITNSDNTTTTVVSKCLPYTVQPTMTTLEMGRTTITFTYSTQKFN